MAKPKNKNNDTAATVGYEAQLWQMADAPRGSMDAAEYGHVCLGLLVLKYIASDEPVVERDDYGQVVLSQRLRESLLPRVSGDLRLDDAKKFVARAR